MCFDPTLGNSRFTTGSPELRCDAVLEKPPSGSSATPGSKPPPRRVKFSSVFQPYGRVTLEFIKLRSPLGVFEYVGQAWGTTDDVPFLSDAANQLRPLVDIVEGSASVVSLQPLSAGAIGAFRETRRKLRFCLTSCKNYGIERAAFDLTPPSRCGCPIDALPAERGQALGCGRDCLSDFCSERAATFDLERPRMFPRPSGDPRSRSAPASS